MLRICSNPGASQIGQLCIEKYAVITFTRRRVSLRYDYALDGSILERKSGPRDLGVLLDAKLSFHGQLDDVVTKRNQLLGLLKHLTREINDPTSCKMLYCTLVRSVVRVCCMVANLNNK